MEHYTTVALSAIGATFLGIFTIIKSCDWLISLKYLSKDLYKKDMETLSEKLSSKFATVESHKHLKEDIDEIKTKLNDIHEVIMTFAVHNLNDR